MNHPYEQLADLVDGTLGEDDRAGVQAHLDTCASCRGDLAHATAGREAARSLPQLTPPADLHRNVVVAAGGRGHGAPAWYRWAGVAAAAAVVVAIAIALPNVGGNGKRAAEDSALSAQAGSEAASQEAGGGYRPEVVDRELRREGPRASGPRHHLGDSGARSRPPGRLARCGQRRPVRASGLRRAAGRPIGSPDPSQVRGPPRLHRRLPGGPRGGRTPGHRGRLGRRQGRLHHPVLRLGSHLAAVRQRRGPPNEGRNRLRPGVQVLWEDWHVWRLNARTTSGT